METCVRGFSFMPETKVADLKYVESDALERTWRMSRRERLKKQEQKIWEEFVNEQDIVQNMCKEDPYQFLNELPQECIKELLDIELQKMTDEKEDNVVIVNTELASSMVVEPDNQHIVTFSEAVDTEECNMFNIFDEDNDEEASGVEEERGDTDSVASPLCTVRERGNRTQSPEVDSAEKTSSKSSGDNVTNMIEGSIYCAKVKEVRMKIREELLKIIGFLEKQDIINIDPADLPKLMKRSVEFCARFSRVHMYQLQRQITDIARAANSALPFAQRTHFQAQLVRMSSLHQNLLHALQILYKSLSRTACIKESGEMLRTVVLLVREVTRVCGEARPKSLAAATDLFDDRIQSTCENLEESINEYAAKMSDFMNSTENTSVSCSRRSGKLKCHKRSVGTWSKSGTKSIANTDAGLSMYSLATLRAGHIRSTSSKDNQSSSGTSKNRASISDRKQTCSKEERPPKSPKRSPRSRRPLMRAPQRTRPKRVVPKEQDVRTLVENVAPCASSHISRDESLNRSIKGKDTTPQPGSKETTPRTSRPKESSRTPTVTPRNKLYNFVARNKTAATSPLKKNNVRPTDKTPADTPRDVQAQENRLGTKVTTENGKPHVKEQDKSNLKSPRSNEMDLLPASEEPKKSEREKNRTLDKGAASCEVTRLVRQLCGGDSLLGYRHDRAFGAKNAQLLCVNGGSPKQPSTPQLLRILEETIQKKKPKSLFPKQTIPLKDTEKFRMSFNIPERVTEDLFQYRTKFVQHMLTSSMYANSSVGKPWEKIGSVSEKILDDLLLNCAREMELQHLVRQMYQSETCAK